jgi:hypothetical protein
VDTVIDPACLFSSHARANRLDTKMNLSAKTRRTQTRVKTDIYQLDPTPSCLHIVLPAIDEQDGIAAANGLAYRLLASLAFFAESLPISSTAYPVYPPHQVKSLEKKHLAD